MPSHAGTMVKWMNYLSAQKEIQCGSAKYVDAKGKVLYQYDTEKENIISNRHDELFAAIAKANTNLQMQITCRKHYDCNPWSHGYL